MSFGPSDPRYAVPRQQPADGARSTRNRALAIGLSAADVTERVEATPFTLMSPHPGQEGAIVLSAWGGGSGAPAADSADAGFTRDMAVHHQQAVEMSFIVRDRTDGEDVRRLAYDVANTQADQRGMLLGRLDLRELPKVAPGGEKPREWTGDGRGHAGHGSGGGGGLMPGMASKDELQRLGGAER